MSDSKEVTNWEAKLAEAAKSEQALVRPSSSNISLRAGVISYEGQPVPDNKLQVVVLGFAAERTYYDTPYDADNPTNPACFALGLPGEELAPHENVPEPVHPTCEGCPYDQWGSAGNGRRGKACSEKKRLALIPAHGITDMDKEGVLTSEVATMKVSVTNVKMWDNYVSFVANSAKRPTWAVVTEVSTKPDPKTQFKLLFNYVNDVPSELLGTLDEKRATAEQILLKPYDMSETAEPEKPKARGSKHTK